jgi:septal ring factor EnvC (AmiA/AmiB activator)
MPDSRQFDGKPSDRSGADGARASRELYLEVRDQGAPVNPGRWLNKAG